MIFYIPGIFFPTGGEGNGRKRGRGGRGGGAPCVRGRGRASGRGVVGRVPGAFLWDPGEKGFLEYAENDENQVSTDQIKAAEGEGEGEDEDGDRGLGPVGVF